MDNISDKMLRYGLGATFIITSLFIFRDGPASWTGYLQPWVENFLSARMATELLYGTAYLDMLLGLWLLSGKYLRAASLLAALHLVGILIVAGITSVTYRDIGLLAVALALFTESSAKPSA